MNRCTGFRSHSLTTILSLFILALGAAGLAVPVAAQTTEYRVTFTATWSAETHPDDFPGFSHFSPLIGGTHDEGVTFWDVGDLASLGIQRMAEWGSQTPLDEEVEAAIAAGHAGAVLRDDVVLASPGVTSFDITVSEEFSLVTLVTMVAPSPDWFVGVSGLDLREGGDWVESLTVTLWPFDAGTDSGASYGSPDQPTDPHEPISAITDRPLANGVPIGTFEFTRLDGVSDVPAAGSLALGNAPNPFNPTTSVVFSLPRAGRVRLDVFDIAGRRVDTLLDEERAAGRHRVTFAPEILASGTYLVRMRTSGNELVHRMMLIE